MTRRRIDFEVPRDAEAGNCKSCGARIFWIASEKDDGSTSWMPIDGRSVVLDLLGARRGESHFAHCPDAGTFRRRQTSPPNP